MPARQADCDGVCTAADFDPNHGGGCEMACEVGEIGGEGDREPLTMATADRPQAPGARASMRWILVVATGISFTIAACGGDGYRVLVHVPAGSPHAIRVELAVIASCGDVPAFGVPPAAVIRSVVVDDAGSLSIGTLGEGEYGLYAGAWEAGCLLFAVGCLPIEVEGGGEGDFHLFLSTLQAPIGCDAAERCEDEACIAASSCADVECSQDEICREGRCVDAQADDDGDGFAVVKDCDDSDPDVVPGARAPCATDCAVGQRTCQLDGSWSECSAPEDCGCEAGDVRREPCGRCGTSERSCAASGRWGDAGPCEGEGECLAGDTRVEPCGPCATAASPCSPGCSWEEGECTLWAEPDEDRDGFESLACGGDDCDDSDPEVHPGAADGWVIESVDPEHSGGGRPSLAIGGDGVAHVAYLDGSSNDLRHAARDATGWVSETVDSGSDPDGPSSAVGPDGVAHIAYFDSSNEDLRHAVDEGESWTLGTVDFDDGSAAWSSLAVGPAGDLHVAYWKWSTGRLQHAFDGGDGWSLETVDAERLVQGGRPSVAVGPDGAVHIAYADDTNGLRHAAYDGVSWALDSVDPEANTGWAPSVSVGPDGAVHIAYTDNTSHDLRHAVDEGDGWTLDTVDSSVHAGGGPSIVVEAEGVLHIAYLDMSNRDLRHAVDEGDGWTLDTVDSVGDTGQWPSLAVEANGTVHVAYYDGSEARLRHGRKAARDLDCDGLPGE